MATLYFGWPSGEYAGYWGTLSNWFTNSACTIPAAALPTINDHVVIQPQPGAAPYTAAVCVVEGNATAASVTATDTRPIGFGGFTFGLSVDYQTYVQSTITVAGNITLNGVDFYNQGVVVCGGTFTVNISDPNHAVAPSVVFAPVGASPPASITCPQLIVNDSQLYLQGSGSIVGNVQGNITQPLFGSGHAQSKTNTYGFLTDTPYLCRARLKMIPPMYGVLSITGNLTLNNGYSVMFGFLPVDFNFTHAGCLVTGNVTMTKTSLFAGTANGTGYMDIESLIAAHMYQGAQNIGPYYDTFFDCGVYGGGVVAVYDKGINGSSILGVV